MSTRIEATIFVPGYPFGADFFIKAIIEVEHFGQSEVGRGYLADPANYDPGSAPEWSVFGTPELHLDLGGGKSEIQTIGPEFAARLADYITEDKQIIEQVEAAISEAKEDA
jgi:hypothetical protein